MFFVDFPSIFKGFQVSLRSAFVLSDTFYRKFRFIVEGNCVRIVNSAVYAMQMLQNEMNGEAERAGITSEDDIMALIDDIRSEGEAE
jgi:DNA-binding transcriptional regulator GbsR (MarR family)